MTLADIVSRCTFAAAGTKVDCAVSGGADSMALMALAVAAGCVVTAHHVDHGSRSGSAAEADAVAVVAFRLGAACQSHTISVEPGANWEARARAGRYAVLPAGVLTGHTADDQAETVLINLLRGAGLSGMSGMRPGSQRPLLALRRADTHEVCRRMSIQPLTDPTNADPRFLRNRVRHELLPSMNAIADRDLVPILTRQGDLARDDGDLLDRLAGELDPTDALALAAAPVPLARRAVRRWLTGEHPPDAATVERVLAVARGEAGRCDTGAGWSVLRRHQRLSRSGPTDGKVSG